MYATVRRYAGNSELADVLVSRQDEVKSIISEVPGFHAYYLIRAEGDTITVTVCDDQAGASRSNEVAAGWLRENLPDLSVSSPEISAGEVVLSA